MADGRGSEAFDPQTHQAIMGQHVAPADLHDFLDRLGEQRAAAAQERQVHASRPLHRRRATPSSPPFAADRVHSKPSISRGMNGLKRVLVVGFM